MNTNVNLEYTVNSFEWKHVPIHKCKCTVDANRTHSLQALTHIYCKPVYCKMQCISKAILLIILQVKCTSTRQTTHRIYITDHSSWHWEINIWHLQHKRIKHLLSVFWACISSLLLMVSHLFSTLFCTTYCPPIQNS